MKMVMTALAVVLLAQAGPAFGQSGDNGGWRGGGRGGGQGHGQASRGEWAGDRPQRDGGGGRQAGQRGAGRSMRDGAPSVQAREAPSAPQAPRAQAAPGPREPAWRGMREPRPRLAGGGGVRPDSAMQDRAGRRDPALAGRVDMPGARRGPGDAPGAGGHVPSVVGGQAATPRGGSYAGWNRRTDGFSGWSRPDRGSRGPGDGGSRRGEERRGEDRRVDGRGDGRTDWASRGGDRSGDGRWDRRDGGGGQWDRGDGRRDWNRGDGDRREWNQDGRRHGGYAYWARGRYPTVYHSTHRYRHYWRPPVNYFINVWTYGDYLPSGWYGPEWWLIDPYQYDLPIPPPGYAWVRVGTDALLVDEYTGEVVQVVRDVFY